jgi:hypothetical protein
VSRAEGIQSTAGAGGMQTSISGAAFQMGASLLSEDEGISTLPMNKEVLKEKPLIGEFSRNQELYPIKMGMSLR